MKLFKRREDGKLFRSTDSQHWVPIVALDDSEEEDSIKWYGGSKSVPLYASASKGFSYEEMGILHDFGRRGEGADLTDAKAMGAILCEPHPDVHEK